MAKLIGQRSSFTEQKPHASHKLGKRAVIVAPDRGRHLEAPAAPAPSSE